VKKLLLSTFAFFALSAAAFAQGTYVNLTIIGMDPACGDPTITGNYYAGEDSINVGEVTFEMAGAMGVYSALIPTTAESVNLTVCVFPSSNCGFVVCVEQVVYANTMNTVVIPMGGMIDVDQDGFDSSVDCDDNDPYVNPGMEEFCGDFMDNNCDGALDEGCGGGGETDNDNDGFISSFDCNDNDATINPNAMEICGDSIDNNCNILIDEGCGGGLFDFDMDGYDSAIDCNDMDYMVNPGMLEICADMIDNNCNNMVDEEGCTGGGTGGCNPELVLLSDSALWSETPGVVWILFPFNPSNTMTFAWDFGDGNTSTEPFPTNIYDVDGTYTVCLTVTDANGCTGMTCVTFTVTPEGDFLPGGMPMTGFTLNVVNAVPNNVTEVAAEAVVEAFPCPFNDELTVAVQSPIAGLAQLSCYDMTGVLVSQEQINVSTQRNTYSFSTTNWSTGAYTIVLSTPAGSVRRVVMK
jgi:hypothetical protein